MHIEVLDEILEAIHGEVRKREGDVLKKAVVDESGNAMVNRTVDDHLCNVKRSHLGGDGGREVLGLIVIEDSVKEGARINFNLVCRWDDMRGREREAD